jgi:hypothetical protein
MTFSYSQISQYFGCPRRYRYRYLDGWREKETRASMVFGSCFEKALAAFYQGGDCGASLFQEWGAYRDAHLEYSKADDWDGMLRQGIGLLERFALEDRIHIPQPKQDTQIKLIRALPNGHDFVAYLDGIGELDGTRSILEWKTTGARYPEQPEGLTSLDLQLTCYSWISGISEVAIIAFVRKRLPEIQYLKATITEEQRREFGLSVERTISQIEDLQFPPRPGIRFPQNPCVSCGHLGLCLGNQELVAANLVRRPGASDLDWIDDIDQ